MASLARPGGNITGSASLSFDLTAKQLELLKETLPTITKVAFLWNPAEPFHQMALKSVETAARRLRIQLQIVEMGEGNQLDGAFSAFTKERPDALLVLPTTRLDAQQERLAELTTQSRLPALYNKSAFAEAGGLMAYGARYLDFFQRAAAYVDKILKGAKPGRSARRATDKVRAGSQHENRQNTRHQDSQFDPRARRQGDRVILWVRRFILPPSSLLRPHFVTFTSSPLSRYLQSTLIPAALTILL